MFDKLFNKLKKSNKPGDSALPPKAHESEAAKDVDILKNPIPGGKPEDVLTENESATDDFAGFNSAGFNSGAAETDPFSGIDFSKLDFGMPPTPSEAETTNISTSGSDDDIDAEALQKLNDMLNNMHVDPSLLDDADKTLKANKNIDTELEELLLKDKETSNKLDVNNDYSFISDVSVYAGEDTPEVQDAPPEEEADEEKTKLPMKYIIAICAMSALIVLALFTALMLSFVVKSRENKANTIVSNPSYKPNDSNYVFINKISNFQGNTLLLQRMLYDRFATVFSFNRQFDPAKCDISLVDNQGRTYWLDTTYLEQKNQPSEYSVFGTSLRFQPFNEGARSFALKITDNETNEIATYEYSFDGALKFQEAKFLNEPVTVASGDDWSLVIDNGYLSGSGSYFNYVLMYDSSDYSYDMGIDKDSSQVIVSEGAKILLPLKSTHSQYKPPSGDLMMGRIDVSPVRDLVGTINFSFNNMSKQYPVNMEVPMLSMYGEIRADNPGSRVMSFDNYDVYFERMGKMGDKYVLVVHSEDVDYMPPEPEATPQPSPGASPEPSTSPTPYVQGELDNRIETTFDINLVATLKSGEKIIIPGTSYSNRNGTDVIFDTAAEADRLKGLGASSFSVAINSVHFKLNEIKLPLDLSKLTDSLSKERQNAIDNITRAFSSRLDYKSGKYGSNNIFGFSEDVISNANIMNNYLPFNVSGQPSYNVQVVSYFLNGSVWNAIVSEAWKGTIGGTETVMNKTHLVTVEVVNGKYVITDDVVE